MWQPIESQRPLFEGGAAAWWEELAKPAIANFCQVLSITLRRRSIHTRRFFVRALELALMNNDWVTITACRRKIKSFDREAVMGLSVWSGQPLLAGELPSVFHYAAEGRHGGSPGVQAVKTAAGAVLTDPAAVEAEILRYFGA
jgi:hypothetical protein